MKPETNAPEVGQGMATTVPDPICFRVYDKPCDCSKCESRADYLDQIAKENDRG